MIISRESNKITYPSGSIDKSRIRSSKFMYPLKELNVPSHIQDEVSLEVFLSYWLYKFVFPKKDVGFIFLIILKVAFIMAAGKQFSFSINLKLIHFSKISRESYLLQYFPWLKLLFCVMMETYRSSRVTTLYVFDSAIWLFVMIILVLLSFIILIDLINNLDLPTYSPWL